VSPQDSDLVLATDVPNVELDVLELDGFHVETDGWDGVEDFAQLQLVNDGGLASGIQTEHQNSGFGLTEHFVEQFCET
jgi:hypothetical protein